MKKIIFGLTTGIFTMASAAHALTAMEDAIAREECDGGPIVSAEYDANGELQVQCPVAGDLAGAGGTAVLAGTAAAGGQAVGLILGVGVLAAAGGGGGRTITTATTTSTR